MRTMNKTFKESDWLLLLTNFLQSGCAGINKLGEAAQHGKPLQTPLVSLINPHTMLGCLYCVRGVWRRDTCQYPTCINKYM